MKRRNTTNLFSGAFDALNRVHVPTYGSINEAYDKEMKSIRERRERLASFQKEKSVLRRLNEKRRCGYEY